MKDNNDTNLKQIAADIWWDRTIESLEREDFDVNDNVPLKKAGEELYDIDIKDKVYELSWKRMILQSLKSFVDVNFRLKNYKDIKKVKYSNHGMETGITGTGDAKEVFNQIVNAIATLVKRDAPDYITFQAREENRQRTYKLIIRQVLRKVGGYKLISISPLTNTEVESDEFWLEKAN